MLTTRTGERYEVLLHAFVPLLPYCLMDAPQPCGVICPHCLTPLLPTLLLTLLTVTREWFTTQRALDLALSVSVLGTMGSWLYSGLLVGRTEEQNKILWGESACRAGWWRRMCLHTVSLMASVSALWTISLRAFPGRFIITWVLLHIWSFAEFCFLKRL